MCNIDGNQASNAWSAKVEQKPEKNTALWSLDKFGDRIELLGVNESAVMSLLPVRLYTKHVFFFNVILKKELGL